jgi:hypothetical protein
VLSVADDAPQGPAAHGRVRLAVLQLDALLAVPAERPGSDESVHVEALRDVLSDVRAILTGDAS